MGGVGRQNEESPFLFKEEESEMEVLSYFTWRKIGKVLLDRVPRSAPLIQHVKKFIKRSPVNDDIKLSKNT